MVKDAGAMICSTTMGEQSYGAPSVHGRARAAGVAVGIGVDGALAFTHDYFQHVRGAFYNLLRADEGRSIAAGYQGADVLDFVTALGARAIREEGVTGTISVGKRADVLLLDTGRIGFPTVGSLADRVVNYANQPDIDSVWIAGVARKRHGKMIGVDLAALKGRITEASTRINRAGATINFV